MTLVVVLLALYTVEPCAEVCEVLEMEHRASAPCSCVCYDPVIGKTERVRIVAPGCEGW